jgi:inorganic pyrophosphatase/exopolyphosphatase
MEFASVKTKEIRDFLRATEMLLSLLRRAEDGQVSKHELLMIQTYIASLKAHLLEVENSELVQRAKTSISAS